MSLRHSAGIVNNTPERLSEQTGSINDYSHLPRHKVCYNTSATARPTMANPRLRFSWVQDSFMI